MDTRLLNPLKSVNRTQFAKALSPIDCTLGRFGTSNNDEQSSNTLFPSSVMDEVPSQMIVVKLVQPLNAELPISKTDAGIVMVVSETSPIKALLSIVSNEEDNWILAKAVAPSKADSPRYVTLLPIVTAVIEVSRANVLFSILVTELGILITLVPFKDTKEVQW